MEQLLAEIEKADTLLSADLAAADEESVTLSAALADVGGTLG